MLPGYYGCPICCEQKLWEWGKNKDMNEIQKTFLFKYVEILFSSWTQLRTNEYWLDNYDNSTLFGQLMKVVEFECDEAHDINQ